MKKMLYRSSRNDSDKISASKAIHQGLSDDGGLFIPLEIPKYDISNIENLSYQELAFDILSLYLSDFDKPKLKTFIDKAYSDNFDAKEIAPLLKHGDEFYLELFHGSTLAFKDMALSLLPYLMIESANIQNEDDEIVVLVATSGDTGKAALDGFKDLDGTKVVVYYPDKAVSYVQELQMTSQKGENLKVFAIKGNFDNAQSAVKDIFSDKKLNKKLKEKSIVLSSANSINIGRLLPQIVYYFYAYSRLLKNKEIVLGEKINFTVPTGNFGNILAGLYAKRMGLPINKLICASNINNVLYDFFKTEEYNANRKLEKTSSPSMDILLSSNFERMLFELSHDYKLVKKLMNELNEKKSYKAFLDTSDFAAEFANEKETFEAIKTVYENTSYLIDPHTAVAYACLKKYQLENDDKSKNVIISTASPYKFTEDILRALNIEVSDDMNENFEKIELLSKVNIPKQIKELAASKVLHSSVLELDEIKDALIEYLL